MRRAQHCGLGSAGSILVSGRGGLAAWYTASEFTERPRPGTPQAPAKGEAKEMAFRTKKAGMFKDF